MSLSIGEILIILLLAVVIVLQLIKQLTGGKAKDEIKALGDSLNGSQRQMGEMLAQRVELMGKNVELMSGGLLERQDGFIKSLEAYERRNEDRFKTFSGETEQKLENIRGTLEQRLGNIQRENSEKLENMRKTVDERLQETLERKMNESFKLVSDRLEQVYKGLGEMQGLASGVGDLKKVLSNVKTRGILGEIQLGAILQDMLAPDQYEVNCRVKPGSREVVEFAVKIPALEGRFAYLPVDSKFPGDTYTALRDAYEAGDKAAIEAAAKLLRTTLKAEAKEIHDKYISPPETTDFAIMFLPTEGLYAEAVNRGMLEELQRDYRVTLAGPGTMAAMLSSIRMCFRSVAMQECSEQVWQVLGAVKSEFGKFEAVLTNTQSKLNSASAELDKLVGVRTRAINRKLKEVTELDMSGTEEILGEGEE